MKILQNVLIPFLLFFFGLVMLGCEPKPESQDSIQTTINDPTENQPTDVQPATADLKSGNMFYIARDIADVQLKAGTYISEIQQLQTDLQDAVAAKDPQKLDQSVQQLKTQLLTFNQTLTGLNLKSQEITQIRTNIVKTNEQFLSSPLFREGMNLSNLDFAAVEKQMGNIQNEMVQLASMLLMQSTSTDTKESSEE